ncbi:MAG: hypothetical protein OXI30_10040 [Chloroflexota bacterium]|nr:hypothetical protein [Chloroflexota bacterium]
MTGAFLAKALNIRLKSFGSKFPRSVRVGQLTIIAELLGKRAKYLDS